MTTSHACIISAAGEIRLEDFLPAGAVQGDFAPADFDSTDFDTIP